MALFFPCFSNSFALFCFFSPRRKCIRKTPVEATAGAEITECRKGANGQMPSDWGGVKGVALPGIPVERFTVNETKKPRRC